MTCSPRGADFGAWLGLVPKQISTGDRTILGKISKRGNKYLRTLFVQAAHVVLLRPANWGSPRPQAPGSRRPPSGCTTTCWRSHSRTSPRASPGACCITVATSRSGKRPTPTSPTRVSSPTVRACHRARCTQGRALRVALKRVSLDSLCARRPRHPAGRGGRKPAARSNKRNGRMKGGDHARLSPHSRQGLRERKEPMEQRSSRRLRELVTPIAPIEACLLIRLNARSYP